MLICRGHPERRRQLRHWRLRLRDGPQRDHVCERCLRLCHRQRLRRRQLVFCCAFVAFSPGLCSVVGPGFAVIRAVVGAFVLGCPLVCTVVGAFVLGCAFVCTVLGAFVVCGRAVVSVCSGFSLVCAVLGALVVCSAPVIPGVVCFGPSPVFGPCLLRSLLVADCSRSGLCH